MPDDLLRYLDGPTPYSGWWLVIGLLILLAVIGWCAGVLVWTMPSRLLRRIPLIRTLHARVVQRRFAKAVRSILDRHRAGELSTADAAAAIRRSLRSFLALQTDGRAHYMHVSDMADSDLASAAPVFAELNDAQFGTRSGVDLTGVGRTAEELITSWT